MYLGGFLYLCKFLSFECRENSVIYESREETPSFLFKDIGENLIFQERGRGKIENCQKYIPLIVALISIETYVVHVCHLE